MNFVTKEPINKGWSSDKKYCVTDENGTRYLLRVSDIAQHDTKQSEFNMMKQVASFGVSMLICSGEYCIVFLLRFCFSLAIIN